MNSIDGESQHDRSLTLNRKHASLTVAAWSAGLNGVTLSYKYQRTKSDVSPSIKAACATVAHANIRPWN